MINHELNVITQKFQLNDQPNKLYYIFFIIISDEKYFNLQNVE